MSKRYVGPRLPYATKPKNNRDTKLARWGFTRGEAKDIWARPGTVIRYAEKIKGYRITHNTASYTCTGIDGVYAWCEQNLEEVS